MCHFSGRDPNSLLNELQHVVSVFGVFEGTPVSEGMAKARIECPFFPPRAKTLLRGFVLMFRRLQFQQRGAFENSKKRNNLFNKLFWSRPLKWHIRAGHPFKNPKAVVHGQDPETIC